MRTRQTTSLTDLSQYRDVPRPLKIEKPPGPTRSPRTINTMPRMMLPVKSSTIPTITRTTAAIHKMKLISRVMAPAYPRLLRLTPALGSTSPSPLHRGSGLNPHAETGRPTVEFRVCLSQPRRSVSTACFVPSDEVAHAGSVFHGIDAGTHVLE